MFVDGTEYPAGTNWEDLPLVSTRSSKGQILHVRGQRGPRSDDVYASGLIPAWGLDGKSIDAEAVAGISFGDVLEVHQNGGKWRVQDANGTVLGNLRWRIGDSGKRRGEYGPIVTYPVRGYLRVERAVLNNGTVVDIGGTVQPMTS